MMVGGRRGERASSGKKNPVMVSDQSHMCGHGVQDWLMIEVGGGREGEENGITVEKYPFRESPPLSFPFPVLPVHPNSPFSTLYSPVTANPKKRPQLYSTDTRYPSWHDFQKNIYIIYILAKRTRRVSQGRERSFLHSLPSPIHSIPTIQKILQPPFPFPSGHPTPSALHKASKASFGGGAARRR